MALKLRSAIIAQEAKLRDQLRLERRPRTKYSQMIDDYLAGAVRANFCVDRKLRQFVHRSYHIHIRISGRILYKGSTHTSVLQRIHSGVCQWALLDMGT
jgi:hypothetical protein